MALDVLLTCWPPAPLARNTSSRMSSSRISISTRVVHLRRNIDRGEARLPLAFGVERADPHQPVHARLALEIAVGHRPADGDAGALNAGHAVVLPVEQLDVVVVRLRPVDVHPQQHLGPIVGVGAAVAGVDAQDRVVAVVRAAQQRLQLQIVELRLRRASRCCAQLGRRSCRPPRPSRPACGSRPRRGSPPPAA